MGGKRNKQPSEGDPGPLCRGLLPGTSLLRWPAPGLSASAFPSEFWVSRSRLPKWTYAVGQQFPSPLLFSRESSKVNGRGYFLSYTCGSVEKIGDETEIREYNYNNSKYLWSMYCGPDTVLSVWHQLTHLILVITLWVKGNNNVFHIWEN